MKYPAVHLSLLALIILSCAGCGSPRSATLTQWKADHEYAKLVSSIPANPQSPESVSVYQYTDDIPRIAFAYGSTTGVYSMEHRSYGLSVDQVGNVVGETVGQ